MRAVALLALVTLSCAASDDLDNVGSGRVDPTGGTSGTAGTAGRGGLGGRGGSAGSTSAGTSFGGVGAGGASGEGPGGAAGVGGLGGGNAGGASGGVGGAAAGGTSGAAGSAGTAGSGGSGGTSTSCFSYENNLDDAGAAQDFSGINEPAGSQWGMFGESWDWGAPVGGPGADHTGGGMAWGNRLTQPYRSFESSALQGPVWDLSGVASATLEFYHWLEVEWCTGFCGANNPSPTALDGGHVTCWNGSDWELAAPAGGYLGTIRVFDSTGISPPHPLKDEPGFAFDPTFDPQWKKAEIVLPQACLRSDARVRFRFGSDSGGGSAAGWYIDDVVVRASCD